MGEGPQDVTYACIDAGGTRTRMLASRDGRVIFRGHGGPANPTAVDDATLHSSIADATRGCPPVDSLLAAVAGAGSQATQERIRGLLKEVFPQAAIQVVPDYAGAFWSSPPGTDLCIIAGTSMSLRHITHFPFMAKKVVLINLQPTPDDEVPVWHRSL